MTRFSLVVLPFLTLGVQSLGAQTPAAAPQAAAPAAADTIPSDTIIARYYTAVGGRDKLLAIKSRKLTGTYTQGKLTAKTIILWSRPGVRKILLNAPGLNYGEGYDGSAWRHDFTTGKTVRDTGKAIIVSRRGAEFDESFIQYAAKKNRVTSLGTGMLDGQPTYGIHVMLSDGSEKDYYFDGKTSLITAIKRTTPLPNGRSLETLTTYSDWKAVDGVLMAHTFTERSTGNGQLINRVTWDTIEVNVPTTVTDFRPPADSVKK